MITELQNAIDTNQVNFLSNSNQKQSATQSLKN